jgi:hypothetical protein
MPWEKGFVPSDGFRTYIHGTNYKYEFEPCGHMNVEKFDGENIEGEDLIFQHIKWYMKLIIKKDGKLKKNARCIICDKKITGIRKTVEVKTSEMPESQFKTHRIMGWV